ncbi:MAG: hypothetical protein IJG45_06535 [Oscillospiraceae bacterium]|nr:hypothetical protein [Oscillospiraceae bacterium]
MSIRSERLRELLPCVSHFCVDFACTALLTASCLGASAVSVILCAVLYNGCAFALQLPIGMLADRFCLRHVLSAVGCLTVALGSLLTVPLLLCIAVGLGNACFHVGAGREALLLGGSRAARVGRFVAPGAFGIFLGPLSAAIFWLTRCAAPLLLLACALLFCLQKQEQTSSAPPLSLKPPQYAALVICMFLTVLLRSYMGTVTRYAELSLPTFAAAMTVCVFLGKCLGGSLADRFGAFRFQLPAQLIGTALFALSVVFPPLALPAVLLFNTTMAVTVHTLFRSAPSHAGAMFGLTTLALYLGVLPRLLGAPNPLFTPWGLALIGCISAMTLLLGLRLAQKGAGAHDG